MVNVPTFYSDYPSSNSAEAFGFFVKFVFEKNEHKQKEAKVGPFLIFKKLSQCVVVIGDVSIALFVVTK